MVSTERRPLVTASSAGADSLQAEQPPAPMVSAFRAMGCGMQLTLEAVDQDLGRLLLALGRETVEEIEQCLSRFRPDSELCRMNAGAGRWQSVSPTMATILLVALKAARRTDGLCTPTVLSALEAAGYDRDFARVKTNTGPRSAGAAGDLDTGDRVGQPAPNSAPGRSPRPRVVAQRRLRPSPQWRASRDWQSVRTAGFGRQVWLPAGLRLDLAGVAKGWTADRLADLLALGGPCLVDVGGDLAARGRPSGQDGWVVAVASPHDPDADLALVSLRDAGIATSGTDYRRWTHHGRSQHHLIDPRTGRPAQTDVVSVTVIAPTTTEADVEAKAALLLGVGGGLARLRAQDLAGLVVRADGAVLTTPRWSDYVIPY
ncbi:MAG: FAD:protein FMN transferase [Chloroflexi bacterium]|nr:FAD:protein FMN transferase [Chloroflexota bacterium]